jgi:hypothetical protein
MTTLPNTYAMPSDLGVQNRVTSATRGAAGL